MPPENDRRSRGWVVVTNNPIDSDYLAMETSGAEYWVYQTEIAPTTGTRHIQGYVHFKSARKLATVKRKLPRSNLTPAGGSAAENKVYCTKLDTRAPGGRVGEGGVMPSQGKRSDIEDILRRVREGATDVELFEEFPRAAFHYLNKIRAFRRTLWIPRVTHTVTRTYWGDTGTGKSHAAQRDASLICGGNDSLWCTFPCKETKSEKTWFDGCGGMTVVIIDEFEGEIGFRLLLRMLDWTRMKGPVKGDFEEFSPKVIIITSNLEPHEWYPDRKYTGGPLERRLTENGSYVKEFTTRYVPPVAATLEIEGPQALGVEDPPVGLPAYPIEDILHPDAQPGYESSDSDISLD